MKRLPKEFYASDTVSVARRLLGQVLVHKQKDVMTAGKIVETEAYISGDRANHAFRGESRRTAVMFGPSGRVYLYTIYGIHLCMNIVTGPTGIGEAVLLRALEPMEGFTAMLQRRGGSTIEHLTNGPAKLTQALGITREYNGWDITQPPLAIYVGEKVAGNNITMTTRIGITQDCDRLLRFYITDSLYVSHR